MNNHLVFTHGYGAVVSPANSFGFMDGGLDYKLSERFGWALQERLQRRLAVQDAQASRASLRLRNRGSSRSHIKNETPKSIGHEQNPFLRIAPIPPRRKRLCVVMNLAYPPFRKWTSLWFVLKNLRKESPCRESHPLRR